MTKQEKADIGADCEEFVKSNVGSHLIQRAEEEEMKSLKKLATVDPEDKKTIYELQLKAKVPGEALKWIKDTIAQGRQARREIELHNKNY